MQENFAIVLPGNASDAYVIASKRCVKRSRQEEFI